MFVLPARPRRAWLRAFWLTMSVWVGLVAGVVLPLSPVARGTAALLAAALVMAASVARPREAAAMYALWSRVSWQYARGARFILLALCYAIVFTVVGRTGSRLRLRRPAPGASLWESGRTLPTDAYRSQFAHPGQPWTGRPWTALVVWAFRSRNPWAIVLLPFLWLVSALELDDRAPFPSGIYTLF